MFFLYIDFTPMSENSQCILLKNFAKKFAFYFGERKNMKKMSQQHQKWISLVEQRLKEKGWSKADLTQAVGLRSQGTITDLLKTGKGSVDLKLRVSKILGIREPWEEFEEN